MMCTCKYFKPIAFYPLIICFSAYLLDIVLDNIVVRICSSCIRVLILERRKYYSGNIYMRVFFPRVHHTSVFYWHY
ncbi:hypothetical protein ANCCAN_26619 [Ancylostoma caninum]|uniref:Uncharacterized protein n=1 Tax=Ancylostoma caninum TaxID=29170 RepID=A0A368F9V0_ANCCA|nr:hypothetical protein ANCCAN_26619 [Ancylostoma caninum]